jgi:hypothetical protein
MSIILAHAGHNHEAEAPQQITVTPTEAAPTPSSSPELLIGGGVLLGIIALWLIATYLLNLSFPTRILLVMTAMLVTGITCFQIAPITATIAIAVGMAITLTGVLLQLKGTARRRT